MSKKHHGGPAPVPPGNQPHIGAPENDTEGVPTSPEMPGGEVGMQEHDPKRRLGDFTGKGEHSLQEPGPLNDGDLHSK